MVRLSYHGVNTNCVHFFSICAAKSSRGRVAGAQPLLHSVEGLPQQREIARLAEFLARRIDPLFLQRILGGPIVLVEDGESSFGFAQDRLRRRGRVAGRAYRRRARR